MKVVAKYNEIGYRDAKVVRDSTYRIDKKRMGITIWVDEGNKYFFRNINWVGNTKHTSRNSRTFLGIKRGDVYQSVLDERLYMNQNGRDVVRSIWTTDTCSSR